MAARGGGAKCDFGDVGVFAAAGAGLIVMGGPVGFVLGALCCQLRLICNLLDGLVAVEGGRGGADGAFWNEVPDRVSDILFLGAAGVAAGQPGWARRRRRGRC